MPKIISETVITEKLNGSGIGSVLKAYEHQCVTAKIGKKEAMLLSISLDGILASLAAHFGEDTEVTFTYGRRFGQYSAYVTVRGEEFDPIAAMDERDGTVMSNAMVESVGIYPSYRRVRGANVITLPFPKHKVSDLIRMLVAVVLGVAAGFALRLVPDAAYAPFQTVFDAVNTVIRGLISLAAGPVVLLSVITGIGSIGSTRKIGKLGVKCFSSFLVFLLLGTLGGGVVAFLRFRPTFVTSSELGSVFDTIIDTLASLFPMNVISPLLSGNFSQIVMLSVFVGVTILGLSQKMTPLMDLIGSLSEVFLRMLEKFVALLPAVIFITVAELIRGVTIGKLLDTWQIFVIDIIVGFAVLIIELIYTAITVGVSPFRLFLDVMRAELIGHATASSCAALYKIRDVSLNLYHSEEGVVNFVAPLGIVCYGSAKTTLMSSLAVYAASVCGVSVSVDWILLAVLICTLFSMFGPPVAGGLIPVAIIIFEALGLPAAFSDMCIPLLILIEYVTAGVKVGQTTLSCIRLGAKKKITEKHI